MTRLVSAEEARGLLEGAPGPLTAELDVFDPDEREAEASVNDEGVSVLFTSGTGEMFPTGTQNATDLARWLALNDSKPMRYARLFAAAPDLAATVIALSEERDRLRVERDDAVMSAAVGEAVVTAFRGEEVSDFMQSFAPVMEAQNIGYTVRLLEGDRDALWRVVKDAGGWLRVTDDDENDWPKLPVYAKQVIEERDRLRAILACERGESAPEGWTRCGGLLREWERNYGKGVHGRVKADGRWWVGKLGILDPLGDSSSPPVTHAEGPAGLKLDGIESADRAAAPQ